MPSAPVIKTGQRFDLGHRVRERFRRRTFASPAYRISKSELGKVPRYSGQCPLACATLEIEEGNLLNTIPSEKPPQCIHSPFAWLLALHSGFCKANGLQYGATERDYRKDPPRSYDKS